MADTKLARETAAGTILQLGVYGELLLAAQGTRPVRFHVVTPDPENPVRIYRSDDYGAYVRWIRGQMEAAVVGQDHAALAAAHYPEPVDRCDVCAWSVGLQCQASRRRSPVDRGGDHGAAATGARGPGRADADGPGPVAGAAAVQAAPGFARGVRPGAGAGAACSSSPAAGHGPSSSRGTSRRAPGWRGCPEPSPGDMFLDLEGDSFAREGGREYLFGIVTIAASGAPEYRGSGRTRTRKNGPRSRR